MGMPMSDLIERLRRWNIAENATRTTSSIMRDLSEAADEIELLQQAEQDALEINEKLLAEIERLRKDPLCRCADEVRCEMKAEIERLKDQLSFMTKECKRFEALSDE